MSEHLVDSNEAILAEMLPSDFVGESKPGTHQGWRIVVVDRGWVLVGNCTDHGNHVRVSNARCIRTWGTDRGLGQLITGPTRETKHDWMGEVDVPMRAVIFTLTVAVDAWDIPEDAPAKKKR